MSQDFRSSAWQHLTDGDLPPASNKAWGLVAETVKAISAEHGGFIHKHHSNMEVVYQLRQLVADAGDAQTAQFIGGTFMIADRLHSNFYEGELSENFILDGLIRCEELSQQLFALF